MFGKIYGRQWRQAQQQLAEKEALIVTLRAKLHTMEADMAILLETKADWERRHGKLLMLEQELQARKKRLEELDGQIQAREQSLKPSMQADMSRAALETAERQL